MTPRETRLVRVPDLRSFQRAIAQAATPADPALARATAVLVPSRSAASQLRRTIEQLWDDGLVGASRNVLILPDFLTRAEWYEALHRRLGRPPGRLSAFDREVLLQAAAREAITAGARPPFRLRPGLITAMLGFYDALRRLQRTVDDFERNVGGDLEAAAGIDRGADRMLVQTRFLARTFRLYEHRMAQAGLCDEHVLRAALMAEPAARPLRRVVVTIGDRSADPEGLWPADFALLTRLPGLDAVDIVATERMLAAGLHERLHEQLPGLEELRDVQASSTPRLRVPGPTPDARRFFISRDREEELADVARIVRRDAQPDGAAGRTVGDRTAVVFQRPLAYVYLARIVFGSAGIPYDVEDALPLAAEPYAAALDLLCAFVTSGFTRAGTVHLLRCAHLEFRVDGRPVTRPEIASLDRALTAARYLGDREHLASLVAEWSAAGSSPHLRAAASAGRAALDAAAELAPLATERSAVDHLDGLLGFLRSRSRPLPPDDSDRERHARARQAVLGAIAALRDAHASHDPSSCRLADLESAVKRWIESQTFVPRAGQGGLHLVDARAAPYGDFDDLFLVGLSELDWPDRPSRNIFYPASLLGRLGWPRDRDLLAAAGAAFVDLLRLARRRVRVSTFALEDDSVAPASPLLEDLEACGLPQEEDTPRRPVRIFAHEALAIDPVRPSTADGEAAAWLALRRLRTLADAPAYHGSAGPQRDRAHAVSAVETFLACPFRYFASRVLRIEEETEDEPVLGARARGRFVHDVFRRFFTAWGADGRGRLTPADLPAARTLFAETVEACLPSLPEADRAVERTRLLGSAAGAGLGERTLRFEIERPVEIEERLLERRIDGTFELADEQATRPVRLSGVADRIDLLADGTLRVIDYKSSMRPKKARAVQLPVYAACVQQVLDGYRGRPWRVGEAGYLAFGERRAFVPVVSSPEDPELREGQQRFVAAVDRIARGDFPPQPLEPFRCTFCPYPSVCRKDYVGDD